MTPTGTPLLAWGWLSHSGDESYSRHSVVCADTGSPPPRCVGWMRSHPAKSAIRPWQLAARDDTPAELKFICRMAAARS